MTMTTTGALDARVAPTGARMGAADAATGDVDSTSVVMRTAIAPRAAARLTGGRRTTGAASYRLGSRCHVGRSGVSFGCERATCGDMQTSHDHGEPMVVDLDASMISDVYGCTRYQRIAARAKSRTETHSITAANTPTTARLSPAIAVALPMPHMSCRACWSPSIP